MAKAKTTVSLEANKGKLLAMITGSPQYNEALLRDAAERNERMRQIAESYYQAALAETARLFVAGVPRGNQGRRQIKVRLPGGANAVVSVNWKPLTERWLKSKQRRSRQDYSGKHPSKGAGLFWLDEGKLSEAFSSWIVGRGQVTADKPRIRRLNAKESLVTLSLSFKKLPVGFLDEALRRALLQGTDGGGNVIGQEGLTIPAANTHRGVWRAAWPEYRRPTMRPLAARLGRSMQEQLLKSLKRR